MILFIFRSTLILACLHFLNAQGYYKQFLPDYRQLEHNRERVSTSLDEVPSSKETAKNINTNKNVNVVLNVNSEEVAQRLWQIIQENLMKDSNKLSTVTQQQLKKAILPIISSTRRGLTAVPVTEIGEQLEKITRRALIIDDPDRPPVDREILTRDIVADMMLTIKNVVPNGQDLTENIPAKRMLEINEKLRKKSVKDNRYATLQVKVQRSDISKIIRSMT